jgi:hypothetical protein
MNVQPDFMLKFLGSGKLAFANIAGFASAPGCLESFYLNQNPFWQGVLNHLTPAGYWLMFGVTWFLCFWLYFFCVDLFRLTAACSRTVQAFLKRAF